MSDRERGIPSAQEDIFPKASPSYCCHHLADNVQQRYGIKCRSHFQKCAQVKTKEEFDIALQALKDESIDAQDYVQAIPHETQTQYIVFF